jgi:hypothetical protein
MHVWVKRCHDYFPKDIGYGDFFGSRFFGLRDFWVLKET